MYTPHIHTYRYIYIYVVIVYYQCARGLFLGKVVSSAMNLDSQHDCSMNRPTKHRTFENKYMKWKNVEVIPLESKVTPIAGIDGP